MHRLVGAYQETVFAIMRIVVGFLFTCHGAQKLLGAFGGADGNGATVPLASLLGVAGVIELVGGLLITIGFLGSYAAFIASGQMAAAYFMGHQAQGLLPIQNLGIPAVLYCFVFLYIAAHGSGRFSVASALGRPGLG